MELFEAAKTGNTKFLDRIRDTKSLANQDPQGDTACHVALQRGHLEFASKIASLHPPILYQRNAKGDTVLHYTLNIRQPQFFVECMKCLRNYFGKYFIEDALPIFVHPDYLKEEIMNCKRALRNAEGKTLVYMAAENGYVELVTMLMESHLLNRIGGPNRSTALHAAVRCRNYDIAQLLLQQKPDLHLSQDRDGHTPLHLAVMENDVQMVELLVKGSRSESMNILNKDGISPFHLAAIRNSLASFQLLLQLRPDCYLETTRYGQNALHLAVQEKAADIVEFIVKDKKLSKHMMNQIDNDGDTPLHIAVIFNDLKMVELLIKESHRPESMNVLNDKGFSPFHLAAKMNDLANFQLLLQHYPDCYLVTTYHGENALHLAVQEKAADIVEFIVNDKKLRKHMINQSDIDGDTPLHIAVMLNDLTMVKLLVKGSCRLESLKVLNKNGLSPFHLAATRNYLEIFRILLPLYPEAMHTAVRERNYDITQLILQYKPDLGLSQDGNGQTPHHLAVMMNDLKMVELLGKESRPESINILDKDGISPFHLAAIRNYLANFQLLLQLHPDCYLVTTHYGQNALHLAVQEKAEDIVEFIAKDKKLSELLINQPDNDGNTPLHIAVMLNDLKMVELLVKRSQPELMNILNKDGISPFHLAAIRNYLANFQLFLQLHPDCYLVSTHHGQNALHLAVKEKAADIVEFIVKDKKLSEHMINQPDNDGNTPLHIVVMLNDLKMVELLVKGSRPESINILNKDGISPYHLAAIKNYLVNFQLLSELRPDCYLVTTHQGQNALHLAVQEKTADIVEFIMKDMKLSKHMINQPDNNGNTPLHIAVMLNDLKIVKLLVKGSCRPESVNVLNKDGFSPFHLAATMNYIEIFRILLPLCPEAIMILIESPLLRRTEGPNGSTALHVAVRERNYDITQLLLQYKPELNFSQDENGHTPLHLAVIINDLKMVELLVKGSRPESMNILSKDDILPFYLAVTMNYLEIFRLFLQLCPDCYLVTTHHGQNALHLAVLEKAANIVEFIVKDKKLSELLINQPDNDGNTPLHIAVMLNDLKMVELLVKGSQPESINILNKDGISPFHLAAIKNYLVNFQLLLQLHPDCYLVSTHHGQNALHLAVKEKAVDIVEFIVKDKKLSEHMINQPDNDGNTPLHIVVMLNDLKMVELLVKGSRPESINILNKDGISPFHLAAINNYLVNFQLLLELRPDCYLVTTHQGQNALHLAVQEKTADIVEFIMKNKKLSKHMINQPDNNGNTPLHIAVMLNDLKIVKLLVKGSCRPESVNVLNKDGFSPFHLAATMNYIEIFRILLPLCPEAIMILIESPLLRRTDGPNGSTALHVAVRERNYDITQLLLQYKPELNFSQDENGHTPLHLAVILNDLKMVELLVKGSRPESMNILSKDDILPFYLAVTMNYLEIFQLFLQLRPDCYLVTTHHGQNALHLAVQEKATDIVEFIVKDKKLSELMINKLDNDGNTPLHIAVMMNDLKMVELLVKESRPESMNILSKDGISPFHLAAIRNYLANFQLLLRLHPDCYLVTTHHGQNALHLAVKEKAADIVKFIVNDKKLSELMINQPDNDGNTPLHIAVMLNDLKMVKLLVEGSRPKSMNILNKDGISPFHLAAIKNNLVILQLLLQLRPDCYLVTTYQGQNALHLAVKKNVAGIVEFIVKDKKMSELMINQQDNDGNTPLHIAASEGDEKMLNTLLASKAHVLPLKNKEGRTYENISKALEERKIREKQQRLLLKATENFHSSLLVMATLITTVTFTAAFTMPGGYKSDGPDQGMATLLGRAAFKAFLVADAISMCSSVIATTSLILFSVTTITHKKFWILIVSVSSIVISMIFMLVAFAAGVWVVIGSECKWLAILIVVATICALLVLALVFGLMVVPSEIPSKSEDEDVVT